MKTGQMGGRTFKIMKYIITESQNIRLQVLRRINDTDWNWILEIVDEGMDIDNPCDFSTLDFYLKTVSEDSANTYLFNYFINHNDDDFKIIFKYICELIIVRLGDYIKEYYFDKKEDCEN